MDLITVINNSLPVQIALAGIVLGVSTLLISVGITVARRGVDSKWLKIPGRKIAAQTVPTLAESRTIVQEGVIALGEYLLKLAGDVICGKDKAGCYHPKASHEYALIVESLQPYLIGQIMQSVERNHYSELTEQEWADVRDDLFRRVFFGAEAYIEKRFEDDSVQLTVLREQVEAKTHDFEEIFRAMAERLRFVSIKNAQAK